MKKQMLNHVSNSLNAPNNTPNYNLNQEININNTYQIKKNFSTAFNCF